MLQHAAQTPRNRPSGLSLLELVATLAIVGLLAAIALATFRNTSDTTRKRACYVTKGEIEVQVQLWNRNHGSYPATNLSNIGADITYFPAGLPVCPVDGSTYAIDPTTKRVVGHAH